MDMFPYLGRADSNSLWVGLVMMTGHVHVFLSVDPAESCTQVVYFQAMDSPYQRCLYHTEIHNHSVLLFGA
jgi:hypothetical protein